MEDEAISILFSTVIKSSCLLLFFLPPPRSRVAKKEKEILRHDFKLFFVPATVSPFHSSKSREDESLTNSGPFCRHVSFHFVFVLLVQRSLLLRLLDKVQVGKRNRKKPGDSYFSTFTGKPTVRAMPPLPITPTTPLLAHIRRVHRDCTLVTMKKILIFLRRYISSPQLRHCLREGEREWGGDRFHLTPWERKQEGKTASKATARWTSRICWKLGTLPKILRNIFRSTPSKIPPSISFFFILPRASLPRMIKTLKVFNVKVFRLSLSVSPLFRSEMHNKSNFYNTFFVVSGT